MNFCKFYLKAILTGSLALPVSLFPEDVAKTPTKKEKIPELPHVWFSGGLLCLKSHESGLAFANKPQEIAAATDFAESPLIQPHFKWNCGVRIEGGFQPKQQYFFANWTYIQNTAHGEKSTDATTGFFPTLSLDKTHTRSDYVTSGDIIWRLNTHLIDVGTIYPWQPTKHFILKNHVGLRIASLNQRGEVNYGGGIFNQGIDALKMRNDFIGAGPSIGLCPNILLKGGFSLVGDITASALIGHFHIHQTEKYLTHSLFHHTENMNRLKLALDAKAAIAWQKELLYKVLVICVQAGWEWHEFYGQNQLQHNSFDLFYGNRNITLRGGFISLCVGF